MRMQIGVEESEARLTGARRDSKERQRTSPLHIMEAAESLRALAAVLRKSDTVPNLVSMRVLEEFGLDEEHDALEQQMVAAIVEAKAIADGSAGDQKKYLKACETQRRRWALFVAMDAPGCRAVQPDIAMVQRYAAFMYTFRQRACISGRTGLGDSSAEMAQYTLAQVHLRFEQFPCNRTRHDMLTGVLVCCFLHDRPQMIFTMEGYEGWAHLTPAEARAKAVPFREAIREEWARLKRSQPEQLSAAKPFVKPKWDERAYFLVQDKIFEVMDAGSLSYNAGISDLSILAVIRATCSRSGALGKDQFDLSGVIAKWSRQGENVMSVEALTLMREGFMIELPDGTLETDAQRGQLNMTRIKHLYEEAAAGGYEYSMSLTPDTVAVARRALELLVMYLWRRAIFKVQWVKLKA